MKIKIISRGKNKHGRETVQIVKHIPIKGNKIKSETLHLVRINKGEYLDKDEKMYQL